MKSYLYNLIVDIELQHENKPKWLEYVFCKLRWILA